MVVRVVPRELTEEEKRSATPNRNWRPPPVPRSSACVTGTSRCVALYSTVADIEAAQERAFAGFAHTPGASSRATSDRSSNRLKTTSAQAADLERSGREVDVACISAIEDIQAGNGIYRPPDNDRAKEIEDVSPPIRGDIERFGMLLEVVELRQTLLARQQAEREAKPPTPAADQGRRLVQEEAALRSNQPARNWPARDALAG